MDFLNNNNNSINYSKLEHDTRFLNKVIVITGAGGNFGREGAIYFCLRGAKVIALDLNRDALLDTVQAAKKAVAKYQSHLKQKKDMLYTPAATSSKSAKKSSSMRDAFQCGTTDALMETMNSTMNIIQEKVNSVKASQQTTTEFLEKATACTNPLSAVSITRNNVNIWESDPNREFIVGLPADVTDELSVQEVLVKGLEKLGDSCQTIHLLWNNAGYQGQIKPTLDYDVSDFQKVMNINVTGLFIVLQKVAKIMSEAAMREKAKYGFVKSNYSIVNTASVAGLRGTPAMVAYSSSKAAVLAMTVSCSKDLAPYSIRVNAISPALIGPGYMWTRQNELHAASGSPYFANDPDVVAENKIKSVPMQRLGSVDEVIESVAFLFSESASYTTGTNLVIDGGMSAGLKA